MTYRINIGLAGRENLTNVEAPKPSEELTGLEVLEIARALTGEPLALVLLGWAPASTPVTGVIALEGATMGCGNTWTREAVKGLASDTITVRERTLDGLLEAVFTGEMVTSGLGRVNPEGTGFSCATALLGEPEEQDPVTYGLAILIHARGYTFRSAGNDRRQEHEVVKVSGEVVFTGSTAQIAKWLQS